MPQVLERHQAEQVAFGVKLNGLISHFEDQNRELLLNAMRRGGGTERDKALSLMVSPMVNQYRAAASVLAGRSYARQRAEFVRTPYTPWHAGPAPQVQIEKIVSTMTKPLREPVDTTPMRTTPPEEVVPSTIEVPSKPTPRVTFEDPYADVDVAEYDETVDSVVERLQQSLNRVVRNGARETTIGNVRRDAKSSGWERVATAEACAFCLMLASRGLVYRSQQTASFEAHDVCQCEARPTFKGEKYRQSSVGRAARELWLDTDTAGMSNKESIANFRAELKLARAEGRWDKYLAAADDGDL